MPGLVYILFLLSAAVLVSCDSGLKSGPGSQLSVTLSAPVATGPDAPGLFAGQSATFTAGVSGSFGPYSLVWNFGGAAQNASSTLAASGDAIVNVVFHDQSAPPASFTAVVTVTDTRGVTQTDTVAFSLNATQNTAPVIESLTFQNDTVFVTASDADGDELSFSAHLDDATQTGLQPGNVTGNSAEFAIPTGLLNPAAILAGGPLPAVIVTVTDEHGASVSETLERGSFAAFPLADDTLYAIATSGHAKVGEKVRIVLATGSTAQPLLISSCSVVVENTAGLVHDSVDAGAPDDDGQANTPVDGVWADLGASGLFIEVGTGGFLVSTDLGDGTWYIPTYVLPFNASPAKVSGLLCSFELEFSEPGEYHLSFLRENVVSRTYYQNVVDGPEHFWGDIENDHAYNTIVVE
jgi:hypothetical protein